LWKPVSLASYYLARVKIPFVDRNILSIDKNKDFFTIIATFRKLTVNQDFIRKPKEAESVWKTSMVLAFCPDSTLPEPVHQGHIPRNQKCYYRGNYNSHAKSYSGKIEHGHSPFFL
jgi:hypothetical protein